MNLKMNLMMTAIVASILPCTTRAAYVMPAMGGGQVGMGSAPMIHTDVGFDGAAISLHADTSYGVPTLRPLTPPDSFDPAQPWAVLQDKAYNFQHAWNPAGFITLPAGGGIWVQRLFHTPGLEVYQRPPATPSYQPIFLNDGDRWKWGGSMTHNAYAVLNPSLLSYSATYRVYIGDASTGEPMAGYQGADITWSWNVVPEPGAAGVVVGVASLLMLRRRSAV